MSRIRQVIVPTIAIQLSIAVGGILTARLLGPEGRGYLALAILVPTVLVMVGTFGFPSALAFHIALGGGVVRLVRSVAMYVVLLGIFVTLADVVLVVILFGSAPPAIFAAVAPTVLVTPLIYVQTIIVAIHQGRSDFAPMNATRIAPFAAWSLGVGILWALDVVTLATVCLAFTVAYAIAATVGIVTLKRTNIDREGAPLRLGAMINFGLRGMIGTLSPLENLRIDQMTVGALNGPYALGIYSTGQAFYTLPRLLGESIGMLAYPIVAGAAPARQRGVVLRVCVKSVVALGAVTAAITISLPVVIPFLFGEPYRPSVPVAEVLMAAGLFLALRRLAGDLLRGLGRPGSDSIIEVATWPVLAIGLVYAASGGPMQMATAVALTAATGFILSSVMLGAAVQRLPTTASLSEVPSNG